MKTVETEAQLLRGLLEMPFMMAILEGTLEPEVFSDKVLGTLYAGMAKCCFDSPQKRESDEKTPGFNQASVLQAIRDLGLTDRFEDESDFYTAWLEVEEFEPHLPDEEAVASAAALVRRGFIVRRLRHLLYDAAQRLGHDDADPLSEACKVTESIDHLTQGVIPGIDRVAYLSDELVARLDLYKQYREAGRSLFGLSTGYGRIDQITNGLQPGRMYMTAAWFGSGKAQPLDAGVLTPTGWRRIGSLEVGDVVLGPYGDHRTVTGVFPQGMKSVFEVKTNDGGRTECCGDHLWWTAAYKEHRLGKPGSVKSTNDIAASLRDHAGRLNHILPETHPMRFAGVGDLPLHPYLLGLLLGDGGLTGTCIGFSNPELDIQESLTRLLPAGDRISWNKDGKDGRICKQEQGSSVSSTAAALKRLNLRGLKSTEKFIPQEYLRASIGDRRELLTGLLDTDGHVCVPGKGRDGKHEGEGGTSIEYSTSSERMARDVVELARSLGVITGLSSRTPAYTYKGERRTGQQAYRLSMKFREGWVPVSSAKHLARWQDYNRRVPQRRIAEINPIGRKTCVCISIDAPDGRYITDDYIVTHNTSLAFSIASHIAMKEDLPVVYVMFESSTGELIEKWIAQECGVSAQAMHSDRTKVHGKWSLDTFRELALKGTDVEGLKLSRLSNIISLEAGGMTVREVEGVIHQINRLRSLKGLKKVAAVFWDYIQITEVRGAYRNREQEISQVGRDLVNLSIRMKVPLMALSQLAGPEENFSRESRALQGHCHSFWVARISKEFSGDPRNHLQKASLFMEKNRDAPSRISLPMVWDGRRQRFLEVSGQEGDWPDHDKTEDRERWADREEFGGAVPLPYESG